MFGYLKMIFAVIIISGIAGAGMYVMKLRADNVILKANQIQLEASITSQKKLLEQQKVDFDAIMEANKQMNILVNNLKEPICSLSHWCGSIIDKNKSFSLYKWYQYRFYRMY